MSREIKFRAWLKPRWDDDEDANKMYYDVQNSYDTLGAVKPYDPMNSFDQWLDDEAAIVEQYTGLTDKNSKEIYEGDIVNIQGIKYYVDFEHGGFWFNNDNRKWKANRPFTHFQEINDTEVIGNIHENPELLGGKE